MIRAIDFFICDGQHSMTSNDCEFIVLDVDNSITPFKDSILSVKSMCFAILDDILNQIIVFSSCQIETNINIQVSASSDNFDEEIEGSDKDVDIQQIWYQTRKSMERVAEDRARITVKNWIFERKTLEECISEALTEHIELFEQAHTIRLIFEHREQQLQSRIRDSNFSGTNSYDVRRKDLEDDFYVVLSENDRDIIHLERISGIKRDAAGMEVAIDCEETVASAKKRFVCPKTVV